MRVFLSLFVLIPAAVLALAADPPFALHEAARLGDAKKVKELLAAGADVNGRNRFGATPLWFAASKNRAEVVKLLLDHKADPDLADGVWEATPINLALDFDGPDVVKLLLAAKAKGSDRVLLRAAMEDNPDLVAAALEHSKPTADNLSTALVMTPANAKKVKELLTKAGAKPFPAASDDEKKLWKAMAGSYENPNGARLMLQVRNDALVGAMGRFGVRVLRPVDKLTFRPVGDDKMQVKVELKDDKVARITVGEIAFEPVRTKPAAKTTGTYKDEPATVRTPKNWPSFRGEGATGVAEGQHPPGVWDLTKPSPKTWKTPIPGLGHSCPVVWGDKLFVTTAVSEDPKSELKPGLYGSLTMAKDRTKHKFKVYCLDRETGKVVWDKTAHEGVPSVKRHIKATHANPTPATDGKHLVVSFGSEGLYCFDLDGKQLWKQDLGIQDAGAFNDPEIQWETASSPVIYRDLVIVQCDRSKDSYIAAFRVENGKEAWRTPRDEISSWGSPTVVESKAGAEVVTNGNNLVRGYDPATGKELWTLGRNSQITVPTPFAGDGLIYVTSGYSPVQPIYAIWPGGRGDLTLKDKQESSEQIAWSKTRGGTYMPTPVYYRGYLYTVSNAGQLTCYEGRTGKQVYREKLGGGLGYTASPVAADGRLYFTGEDGKVQVVEAGPVFRQLAENDVGETCLATPAIAAGRIYFRTKGHVIGVGREG